MLNKSGKKRRNNGGNNEERFLRITEQSRPEIQESSAKPNRKTLLK